MLRKIPRTLLLILFNNRLLFFSTQELCSKAQYRLILLRRKWNSLECLRLPYRSIIVTDRKWQLLAKCQNRVKRLEKRRDDMVQDILLFGCCYQCSSAMTNNT